MTDQPNENEIELSDEHIELAQFLDDIFKLDQIDPNRIHATECLKMLLEREQDFIGTPLEKSFWNAVSLESFHIAQQKAFKGNLKDVKHFLNQSLEAAQKGVSDEWLSYIRGTKCYFDGDMDGLQKEISKGGMGKDILRRLYIGFKKRRSVNYSEDYSGK